MNDRRRWPLPWVFSLLILPLGIVVGVKFTPLPYLLAQAGVPVDRIASISAIVNLPGVFIFLWAPLVDVKLRRRTWLAIAILATAFSVCIYFPLIGASHVNLMTTLILAGGVADSLVAAACGGLLVKVLSTPDQAKASAWLTAGQLGGGALGGAIVLWLSARLALVFVGFVTAALIALPALVAFSIPEPLPEPSPWFHGRLRLIGAEIYAVLRAPRRRWSTLLLLAPGGSAAAQSLLPAIASQYGVAASGVIWMNSLAGGVALAVGALCGILIPGNWDRRITYAGAALTNALATFVLLGANRPFNYRAGTLFYLITEGLCWARSTALIVEIVGPEPRDASTLYSILSATATISLLYTIRLDGMGFSKFGTHGLLWTDAAANIFLFAIVTIFFVARGLPLRQQE